MISFSVPIIIGTGICISLGLFYSFYIKYNKNKNNIKIKTYSKIINYSIRVANNNNNNNNNNLQYSYISDTADFENLEKNYRNSLYGNHILKQSIDTVLLKYLKTASGINERYLIINIFLWSAIIEIKSNIDNNKYLIIDIIDPDYE